MHHGLESIEYLKHVVQNSGVVYIFPCTHFCLIGSQFVRQPFIRSLEGTLLAGFDFGVTQITTHSESMSTTLKIFTLVSRAELATSEDLVSLGLGFQRELLIDGAAVDEERGFRGGSVFLWDTNEISGLCTAVIHQPRDRQGLQGERGARRRLRR